VQSGATRWGVSDTAAAPSACVWCGQKFALANPRGPGCIVCPACQVATTSPWPTPEQLEAAYGGWYRPSNRRFASIGDEVLDRTRGLLARRLTKVAPPGPILDVGAGNGALVRALRRGGRLAIGLERPNGSEPSDPASIGGQSSGPAVVLADVCEVTGPWAGVIFWHSLEHLPTPGPALDHATGLLSPGGVLVVAIPNTASLQARIFGDRWFGRDLPRHLVHIPAVALLARLEQNGLDVRRVSYLRGGQVVFGWLEGLVSSLPGRLALYDAIRGPEARAVSMHWARRGATFVSAGLLLPVAALAAAIEVVAKSGGTVYVEARR